MFHISYIVLFFLKQFTCEGKLFPYNKRMYILTYAYAYVDFASYSSHTTYNIHSNLTFSTTKCNLYFSLQTTNIVFHLMEISIKVFFSIKCKQTHTHKLYTQQHTIIMEKFENFLLKKTFEYYCFFIFNFVCSHTHYTMYRQKKENWGKTHFI